jgi:hypothetical protein
MLRRYVSQREQVRDSLEKIGWRPLLRLMGDAERVFPRVDDVPVELSILPSLYSRRRSAIHRLRIVGINPAPH